MTPTISKPRRSPTGAVGRAADPVASPVRADPLGPRAHWARDFALMGGVTSLRVPYLIVGDLLGTTYLLACALLGASTGALVGYLLPPLLTRVLGDIPSAA